jgi:hypothetical protein
MIRLGIIYAILCYSPLFAEDARAVMLDGYNCIEYDAEHPARTGTGFGIISGTVQDTFPAEMTRLLTDGDSARYAVSVEMGSETGDPFLNIYTSDRELPNRDHTVAGRFIVSLPGTRASSFLYGGYRYVDLYSDRFDALWRETPRDFSGEGLLRSFTGGYSAAVGQLLLSGRVSSYRTWSLAPYYFSPLFMTGTKTAWRASIPAAGMSFYTSGTMDFQERYYKGDLSKNYNAGDMTAGMRKGASTDFSLRYRAQYSPGLEFRAAVSDTFSGKAGYTGRLGIFSNGEPFVGLDVFYDLLPVLRAAAQAGFEYFAANHDFAFTAQGRLVKYEHIQYHATATHFTLEYSGKSKPSFSAAAWYDYTSRPLFESVDTALPQTIIRQMTGKALSTAGLKAGADLALGPASITPWAEGHVVVSGRERISIPWRTGLKVKHGKMQAAPFFISADVCLRGPARLTYFLEGPGTWTVFESDRTFELFSEVQVPYVLPFLGNRIKSFVTVEAGPFHLMGKERMESFPFGNPMGPRVLLRLDFLL